MRLVVPTAEGRVPHDSNDPSTDGRVRVEIVCALPGRVFRCELALPAGTRAGQVLGEVSRRPDWPADAVDPGSLGVFSKRVGPDFVLSDGDRLECYRPLSLDPKDARRKRAGGRH